MCPIQQRNFINYFVKVNCTEYGSTMIRVIYKVTNLVFETSDI